MSKEKIKTEEKVNPVEPEANSQSETSTVEEMESGSQNQESSKESDQESVQEQDEEERLDLDEEDSEENEEPEKADESETLNNKYLRLYAEFENFRKRTARESLETYQNANAKVIEKLLPILQDFERAFEHSGNTENAGDFQAGIKMIYNSFKDVLEDSGLEEINPEGEEFDPNLHEALMQQPHETVEEDHIVQVYEKGYKVKNRIIKHAKVIISTGKQ